MQPHKIENFIKDHPGVEPPWFQTLSEHEALDISIGLTSKLGFSEGAIDSLQLVKTVDSKSVYLEGLNAEKDGFSLAAVFERVGVVPPQEIQINWYRFDQITRMKSADVVRYFEDIWYTPQDDIELFPESLEWMVSIHHEGDVRFLRLDEARN